MSGYAFRFQHFHHLVGGGGGGVLFEVAGNHKDGVPPAYLGHAIRAAGGSGGASVGGVGHRLSFLWAISYPPFIAYNFRNPSVWDSVNTFSTASRDFAKAAAVFLPLLPTTPRKAKMTVICGNFSLFLTKPHKPE